MKTTPKRDHWIADTDAVDIGNCKGARRIGCRDAVCGAAELARYCLDEAAALAGVSFWLVPMNADLKLCFDCPIILGRDIRYPGVIERRVGKKARELYADFLKLGCYAVVGFGPLMEIVDRLQKVAWWMAETNNMAAIEAMAWRYRAGGWDKVDRLPIHDVIALEADASYVSFRESGLRDFDEGFRVEV